MLLADFAQDAGIFIDANIFTYFALQNPTYQGACTAFLSRVEAGEVRGVASVFSLNEAFYTMLIGKGSEILNLPTDALHVATCQQYGISHIATADVHFEQVDLLTTWKPEAAW
jgi:predicted nucleic acid-binding protein